MYTRDMGFLRPDTTRDASDIKNQLRLVVMVLTPLTVLALISVKVLGPLGWLLVIGCFFGWVTFLVYLLVNRAVINPVGDAIGRILVPSGGSTPSAKGLSHIETMVIRGDYAKAVDAYRHEIATDPADVRSCEQLGALAMREMKDYTLAVWAYREAEKRAAGEKARLAYGVIVAELYRDKLNEPRRAVVELSRLIGTYPDSPHVPALKEELELIKSHLFEAR